MIGASMILCKRSTTFLFTQQPTLTFKAEYYDNQGRRVHEEHPRSTVTWKQNGIKHDSKNNRVRLSKGANHKEHPKAWEYILV